MTSSPPLEMPSVDPATRDKQIADCRRRLTEALIKAREMTAAAGSASMGGSWSSYPPGPGSPPHAIDSSRETSQRDMAPSLQSRTGSNTTANNTHTTAGAAAAIPVTGPTPPSPSGAAGGQPRQAQQGSVLRRSHVADLVAALEGALAALPMESSVAAVCVESEEEQEDDPSRAVVVAAAALGVPPTDGPQPFPMFQLTVTGTSRQGSMMPGASPPPGPTTASTPQATLSSVASARLNATLTEPASQKFHRPDIKVVEEGNAVDLDLANWLNANYAEDHHRVSTGFDVRLQRSHSMVSTSPAAPPSPTFEALMEEAIKDEALAPMLTDASGNAFIATKYERNNRRTYRTFASERKLEDLLELCNLPRIHDINSPDFNIFPWVDKLKENTLTVVAANVVFQYNFMSSLQLDPRRMVSFFRALQVHYREHNPYHNMYHAADVLQTTNVYLCCGDVKENFSDVELLAILFGAVVHDVGHLGIGNAFLVKIRHPLAVMFNDQSCLENMHLTLAFILLERPENNFFKGSKTWTRAFYEDFRNLVIEAVMGTDMKHHAALTQNVISILEDGKIEDDEVPRLFKAIVHAADLSNPMKPLPVYLEWCSRVLAEFWQQGDEERRRELPVSPMCDRNTSLVAKSQIGFMEFVVKPFMKELAPVLPPVWLSRLNKNLEYMKHLTPDKEKSVLGRITQLAASPWTDMPINRRSFFVALGKYVDRYVLAQLGNSLPSMPMPDGSVTDFGSLRLQEGSPVSAALDDLNSSARGVGISSVQAIEAASVATQQAHQARLVDLCDTWMNNMMRIKTAAAVAPEESTVDISFPIPSGSDAAVAGASLANQQPQNSNTNLFAGQSPTHRSPAQPSKAEQEFLEQMAVSWISGVLELQQQHRSSMGHAAVEDGHEPGMGERAALKYLDDAVMEVIHTATIVTSPRHGASAAQTSPGASDKNVISEMLPPSAAAAAGSTSPLVTPTHGTASADGKLSPWSATFGTHEIIRTSSNEVPGIDMVASTLDKPHRPDGSAPSGGIAGSGTDKPISHRDLSLGHEAEICELLASQPRLAVEILQIVIGARPARLAVVSATAGNATAAKRVRVSVVEPAAAKADGAQQSMVRFVAALSRMLVNALKQIVTTRHRVSHALMAGQRLSIGPSASQTQYPSAQAMHMPTGGGNSSEIELKIPPHAQFQGPLSCAAAASTSTQPPASLETSSNVLSRPQARGNRLEPLRPTAALAQRGSVSISESATQVSGSSFQNEAATHTRLMSQNSSSHVSLLGIDRTPSNLSAAPSDADSLISHGLGAASHGGAAPASASHTSLGHGPGGVASGAAGGGNSGAYSATEIPTAASSTTSAAARSYAARTRRLPSHEGSPQVDEWSRRLLEASRNRSFTPSLAGTPILRLTGPSTPEPFTLHHTRDATVPRPL